MALELLSTLRHVLYKWDDGPSCQLAAQAGFGVRSLGLDISDYSYDDEYALQFQHWGTRLLALTNIVNAPAEGWWVWRRLSRARRCRTEHMMLILTFLALLVTVVNSIIGPWMQSQEKKESLMPKIDLHANAIVS